MVAGAKRALMGPSALSITHSMFSCLAIFAHPDDEIGAGATLAYYADAGVRTILICASRGEAATIYCDECATRENLAEVRTRELECACRHLGVAELRWLDWPDGGIRDLLRPEAIGQVVALIRALRPQVILTHPENGLYPHPDHRRRADLKEGAGLVFAWSSCDVERCRARAVRQVGRLPARANRPTNFAQALEPQGRGRSCGRDDY